MAISKIWEGTVIGVRGHTHTQHIHPISQIVGSHYAAGGVLSPSAPQGMWQGLARVSPTLSRGPGPRALTGGLPRLYMTDSFSKAAASPAGPGKCLRRGLPSSRRRGCTGSGSVFMLSSSGSVLCFSE